MVSQKHKNTKMQRSECRTPSWLGGYAERRSISMLEHQNAKFVEFWQKMTLLTAATRKNSLHPSRRMAWENLRHGVAVFFLSPRKKTRHSSPNPTIPIKFYKISKNISIFILLLQNKALSLQRCSGQHKRIRHKYISFIREPAKLKNMFFCSSVEKTLTN